MYRFILAILLVVSFCSQGFSAALITPAFSKFSSAGMAVDAGKQSTNTMQVIGATFSKPNGKPTMTVGPWIDVRSYSSLAAAVSAIGSAQKTIVIPADITVSANIMIPVNIELLPLNNAKINHSTYTISYAGSVARWPLTQIFNGTGAVTFGNNSGHDIYAVWFGLLASNADNTTALQAAINSISGSRRSGTVHVLDDVYTFLGTVTLKAGVMVKGSNVWSRDTPNDAPNRVPRFIHAPTIANTDLFINEVPGVSYTNALGVSGIVVSSTTSNSRYAFNLDAAGAATISNATVKGFVAGIRLNEVVNISLEKLLIYGQSDSCIIADNTSSISTSTKLTDVYLRVSPWGVTVKSSAIIDMTLDGVIFESLTIGGMNIHKGVGAFNVINSYSENVPSGSGIGHIFQVGVDGSAVVTTDVNLTIVGGRYGGINGSANAGSSFINADYVHGLSVFGANILNMGRIFTTTANTEAIHAIGMVNQNVLGIETGIYSLQKVTGELPRAASSGFLPNVVWRTPVVRFPGFPNGGTTHYYDIQAGLYNTDSDLYFSYDGSIFASFDNTGKFKIGSGAPKATLHGTGSTILGAPTAALVDASLQNNSINFYLDESGNNLKIKVKYSTGVVKTATVPLL